MLSRSLLAPDQPFAPVRWPFFYGWVVLLVGSLGVLASIPGQTMGVGVFNEPLMQATGRSRMDLSMTYAIGTVISGLLLPFGGSLLDRLGARLLAMLAATTLGLTLVLLAHCDRLAQALAAITGPIAASWIVLIIGFTMLRFSGQGILTMVSRTMVGKWFDRRRGFVAGLMGLIIAFGFAIAPQLLAAGIAALGWRSIWLVLAVVLGMVAVLAWLFFRDNPEECGLQMDGDPHPTTQSATAVVPPVEVHVTRGEAVRTAAFWAVTLALSIQGMVVTGLTFHITDLGALNGYSPTEAVAFFVPMAVVATATGYLAGLACDRFPIRFLVMTMLVFQIVGFLAMPRYGTPVGLALTLLGLGVSGGFFGPLSTVALPQYFGRRHLGAIAGIQMSALVISSALGPVLLAASERLTGAYDWALWSCIALPLGVLGLCLVARDPQRGPATPASAAG